MESEYLFDAKSMIDAFDMDEFLQSSDDFDRSNGAFLIITDKQCILSYNKDYGKGLHIESMGNALFEIWGREKDEDELPYIFPESEKINIMASLVNEPGMSFIMFHTGSLKSISSNQLELFKQFKKRYQDKFQKCAEENIDSFTVYIENDYDHEYHDLEAIYQYLESIVDPDLERLDNEIILGDTLEEREVYGNKRI